VATVAAIEAAGAVPVLVDVDAESLTLDPGQLQEVLSSKTKAVIAVHLYGQSADLDAIGLFCSTNGLWLIEDGSQAHGATWHGRRVGSVGHIGCFSCYPTKNLGAIGDAGLMTTNDVGLEKRIRMLREYGWERRYISEFAGRNSRLDELQAAVLRIKLRYLDSDNAKRRSIAQQYGRSLNPALVQLPTICANSESVFHLYVVQATSRAKLIEHLDAKGVQTGIHYPMPIHLQPAYAGRIRTAMSMSVTEAVASTVLSLPMYPELASEAIASVIDAVNSFPPHSSAA
jgi:dTDP-4-amino-4,6-dideoxygalactose transaminase